MVVIDLGIVFDFPDNWDRFTEGSRCVFHTPGREEIIVSASRLDGDAPSAELAGALERLFANGIEAARRGSVAPDLRVTKPLAEEPNNSKFRCSTVFAERPLKTLSSGRLSFRIHAVLSFLPTKHRL
jgi:hypothetical protein